MSVSTTHAPNKHYVLISKRALGSMSIIYRSDTKVSDRYLIDVDPRVCYRGQHPLGQDITISNTLQWRHNERDGVSNHQSHEGLLNRLFRRKSKKTSKLRVTGLCAGNSPETGEFPAQMASDAENVSIRWRHHETPWSQMVIVRPLKTWYQLCRHLWLSLSKPTVTTKLASWQLWGFSA